MEQSGPRADSQLAVLVARRHYLAGESKVEIAGALGISRFKVARLLDQARAEGSVRIQVVDPHEGCDPLAVGIREEFGLQGARVVPSDLPQPLLAQELGAAGARLLGERLGPQDCLGLPWSRMVHQVVDALHELPPVPVVQLCGSLVLPGEQSAVDLVRQAAAVGGGSARVFHAPLIMPSPEGAEAVRSQGDVREGLAAVDRVTVAFCSIGQWGPGTSTIYDALSEQDRAAVTAAGACAEVMGIFLDEQGAVVSSGIDDRLVTLSADHLRGIGTVIAISRGAQRTTATRAVLRSGLAHHVVLDGELAEALLRDD